MHARSVTRVNKKRFLVFTFWNKTSAILELCGRFRCVLENSLLKHPCKKENEFLFLAQAIEKLNSFLFIPFNYFWPFHCFVNVLPTIHLICFSTKHCGPDYTSYSTLIQIRQAISKKLKVLLQIYFAELASYISHAHPWRGERKLNFIYEAVYNNVYVHSVLLGCNLLLILITLGTREWESAQFRKKYDMYDKMM